MHHAPAFDCTRSSVSSRFQLQLILLSYRPPQTTLGRGWTAGRQMSDKLWLLSRHERPAAWSPTGLLPPAHARGLPEPTARRTRSLGLQVTTTPRGCANPRASLRALYYAHRGGRRCWCARRGYELIAAPYAYELGAKQADTEWLVCRPATYAFGVARHLPVACVWPGTRRVCAD